MIDSHTHLDLTPGDDADIVARARAAGVTRMLTIGMDADSCRARARRGRTRSRARSSPPSAATRTRPTGFTDADAEELAELAADPRCRAIGETGLDYFHDRAPRADQERAFAAQIEIARARRQAAGHPHAARPTTTRSPRSRATPTASP